MDITSIFIARNFNRELTEKRVETPSTLTNVNRNNKYGDDWIYDSEFNMWRQKTLAEKIEEKALIQAALQVPFIMTSDKDDDNDDNNHMGNHIPNYNYLDEDDETENWVKEHLKRYEREQKNKKKFPRTAISADKYIDDTVMYGLTDEHPTNKILTYDDEIALIFTYDKDEQYVDKNDNIIKIINRTANGVEFTRNAHLGKMRNATITKNRVEFLRMMDFNPGDNRDFYKMKRN